MKVSCIDYSATGAFSSLVLDYLRKEAKLQPFYAHFPEISSFSALMEERQFPQGQRQALVQELQRQYQGVEVSEAVQANISALADGQTFTITTGHQLNLFTGPLYFIYKIVTAIKTAQELQKAYPAQRFVPVYWMATEDHDFAEVNHFTLFGKNYTWESDAKGAVGRFSTDGLNELLDEMPESYPLFEQAYTESATLAEAMRHIVNGLFGAYGVVCVDGDTAALKNYFTPVVQRELTEQVGFAAVTQTNAALEQHYKPQVMVREINLFYLDHNLRERIVQEDGNYKVLNTDLVFTREQILRLAEEDPQKFSPNVVLRPLYQELVLPNLAYIGGGAEVAYWFQLKGLFEAFQVPYPAVMLRNSAMYITKANGQRLEKLGFTVAEMFLELPELKKRLAELLNQEEVSLEAQRLTLEDAFRQVEALAQSIDPTLVKTVGAESQKAQNSLQMLEKKLNKAVESKNDTAYNQLANLKEKLFPTGVLQERVDNLLTYQTNNPHFIQELVAAFEPFAFCFTVLQEE
ncbi:bacillithiol biosynthesis cysteine-adding enzyme BshC [Rufibacter glacialis]|uniref:Putative cysteine ligase BshC n=1 Tax=Rufibacter glacialis TaxID=1259555 RepID=A0A5M8QFI6_9BACT|nr:bacillithiol biosynthesis cysteine-adding enzyme BshC [Rufibacter glacialis]KAA6433182.1 bacillithiol biosynthesis cysteine-adding enzyme BshC [Rufibacter glacialis]GGK76687.1 putative cysteine ligase BshC [Rufibacter glacialis]